MGRIHTALLVAFSTLPSAALAKTPTGQVTLDSIIYSGSGCRDGTASATISPDAEAFTIGFSQFQATVASGKSGHDSSRCTLHLRLNTPRGWSYTLSSVEFIGYAALDSGVTASRQTTYRVDGETIDQPVSQAWTGALQGDYAVNDAGSIASAYWSQCGKGNHIKIDIQIGVDNRANPTGSGLLTVDAVDGEIYHLLWKQCP